MRTVTSPTLDPFTRDSDREADDKVPESSGHGFVPNSRRATKKSMPSLSLTGLKERLRDRADNAARGTDVPAGIDRGSDAAATTSARGRARMRRRLRDLRRLREAQLIELGALMLEAHKHGRADSPAIKSKLTEAAGTDDEARALADALETDAGLDTVIATGIAGPCPTCGMLASTSARFCSTCGTPLDGRPAAAPRSEQAAGAELPTTDAREAHRDADARTTEMQATNGNHPDEEHVEAEA